MQPFTTREELRAYLYDLNQVPRGISTVYMGSCSSYEPLRDAAAAEGRLLSVQVSGELLLLIRNGRLISVSTANDDLRVVESLPVGDGPDGMLLHGNRVFVISDRVQRRLDVVSFDTAGHFTRASSHQWSTSYTLYGWQVVGKQLLAVGSQHNFIGQAGAEQVPEQPLPALSPAGQPNTQLSLQRVYRPVHRAPQMNDSSQLQTLLRCDLRDSASTADLACETTVLPGIWEHVQLTASAAYLVGLDVSGRSVLYRIPADGSTPNAVQIQGTPIAGGLWETPGFANLVLKSQPRASNATFLRLPLSDFGDGTGQADARYYRELSAAASNRVHLLDQELVLEPFEAECAPVWSMFTPEGTFLGEARVTPKWLVAPKTDRTPQLLTIAQRGDALVTQVVRLPPMDSVFAYDSQLTVNVNNYAGRPALGLPVLDFWTPEPRAALVFASLEERNLQNLGSLEVRLPKECDNCEWRYRNAQPVFVRERWFALIGDELIEGKLAKGRLSERRRISLSR